MHRTRRGRGRHQIPCELPSFPVSFLETGVGRHCSVAACQELARYPAARARGLPTSKIAHFVSRDSDSQLMLGRWNPIVWRLPEVIPVVRC